MKSFSQQLRLAGPDAPGSRGLAPLAQHELRGRLKLQHSLDRESQHQPIRLHSPQTPLPLSSSSALLVVTQNVDAEELALDAATGERDALELDAAASRRLVPSRGAVRSLLSVERAEAEDRERREHGAAVRRPAAVAQLDTALRTQLNALMAGGNVPSDRERLQPFQETGHRLAASVGPFGPLLERVLGEYDRFVEAADVQQRRLRDLEAQVDELQRERRNESFRLQMELEQRDREHAATLARIDVRMRDGPSMIDLLMQVESLQAQCEEEKRKRLAQEDKLGATMHIRRDFERTLRAIEETFRVISDEKDLRIAQLTNEVRARREELAAAQDAALQTRAAQQHRIDTLEIAVQALRHREGILMGRVRDHELRNNKLVDQVHTLTTEVEALAERLAQFEGVPDFAPKDVAMTPRPSRAEVASAVPELGDVNKFQSTVALVKALTERHVELGRHVREAEDTMAALESFVSERIGGIRKNERDVVLAREALRRAAGGEEEPPEAT